VSNYMNAAATAAGGGAWPDGSCLARPGANRDGQVLGNGKERQGLSTIRPRRATAGFRALVRQAHALGPRPLGEILLELVPDEQKLVARLEQLASLDRELIVAIGAADWVEPRDIARAVR
jgi:hypothetical protein